MKTAISAPDETFEKASQRARDLGMSRSEFFTRAAARYLDELDAQSVTHQIDMAIDALAITSNTYLASMPGNVFLPSAATGLPQDSIANVTAVVTLQKTDLTEYVGNAPLALLHEVVRGLRSSMSL